MKLLLSRRASFSKRMSNTGDYYLHSIVLLDTDANVFPIINSIFTPTKRLILHGGACAGSTFSWLAYLLHYGSAT